MDTIRLRQLLNRRDEIDQELVALVTNGGPKKQVVCSNCKEEGHTARTCTKRAPPDPPPLSQGSPQA